MKKLFTLFTALMVVITVGAKDWHITNETPDIISTTVTKASTGDVIYLGDGKYNQPNQISFDGKVLTILPEDGAKPIVPIHWYCELKNAAKITIKGVKFVGDDNIYVKTAATYYTAEDAEVIAGTKEVGDEKTPAVMMGASDHCFRPYDATAGKELRLENCEFKGFPDYVILSQRYDASTAYPLDSLIINNCYFHDNTKSCVIFCNQGTSTAEQLKGLIVKNSTIANNSTTADYSAIYVYNYNGTATSNIEVTVDHCTFYNNPTTNTDHSCVRSYKSTKVSISNCIFAHPTAIEFRATNCYGGTISNCLTYNLTKDFEKNGHRTEGGVPTLTANFTANPLFTDAANGDFSYAGNWSTGEVSPARGAGTDGSDLGDPRWYTEEVLPETDFASPGKDFDGSNAMLEGYIYYNSVSGNIYYKDKSPNGTAYWRIHAERACYITATVHMAVEGENGTTGHNLQVELFDEDDNSVGSVNEGGWHNDVTDRTLSGTILIPAAGDYKVVLSNLVSSSTVALSSFTLLYYPVSVVGTSALTGKNWDVSDDTNDMTYDAESGKFVWTKEKFFHDGSSTYDFKIAKNRAYAFPANNWAINTGFFANGAGYYNLKIEYTPSPEAVNVTATHLYPKVEIKGGFNSWALVELENNSEGVLSTTIHITPNDYTGGNGFKVRYNGDDGNQWGNSGNMVRTNCSNWSFDNSDNNCGIITDVEGDYVFSFTIEGGKWSVTYPMTFTREVANTNYGTICLPCAAVLTGATAYSVDPAHVAEGYVTLTEVGTELTAGVPYIIKPEAVGTISAVMSGDAVASPVNNNLYGVWGATQTFGAGEGVYALHDNKLTLVSGSAHVNVPSTKAYFKVAAASAPVLRILEGEEIVTNISDVKDEEQTIKFIENGQLFIRKNGIVYDALGRAVR